MSEAIATKEALDNVPKASVAANSRCDSLAGRLRSLAAAVENGRDHYEFQIGVRFKNWGGFGWLPKTSPDTSIVGELRRKLEPKGYLVRLITVPDAHNIALNWKCHISWGKWTRMRKDYRVVSDKETQ